MNASEIEKVRNCIAGVIYNDGLPTNLVTNSLQDICFQYDNYRKAKDEYTREQALEGIKAGVDMINLQNINSGASYKILHLKDESEQSIADMGEAIATIYAIPYQANLNIDYVGYAYGIVMRAAENRRLYESYQPEKFINQCSKAVLDCSDSTVAESVMVAFENCAGAVNYLKSVEIGEINGDPVGVRNLVLHKFETIASEVEAMTGEHIDTKNDMAEALYIASCINASIAFGNKDNIEQFREDGIFKDSRACDMTIARY